MPRYQMVYEKDPKPMQLRSTDRVAALAEALEILEARVEVVEDEPEPVLVPPTSESVMLAGPGGTLRRLRCGNCQSERWFDVSSEYETRDKVVECRSCRLRISVPRS